MKFTFKQILRKWKFTFISLIILILVLLVFGFKKVNFKKEKLVVENNKNTENRYIQAVKLGADWFLNNQDENFIHYQYYPYKDTYSKNHQRLREFGALWSISKSANYFQDEELKNLAEKGFAYFEKSFKYDEENDFIYVNITPDKIKLGYNAFAILTLLEIDHPKKDYLLEKLANGIVYQQEKNGNLKTFFFDDKGLAGIDYYPGEALLALMSLYEYNHNEKYLETVKKAFPFYVDYWNYNPNTAFTSWQSRAYYKLYKATEDEKVKKFIFEMNDFVLDSYNPQEKCSKFIIPNGVATVHSEGVNMAYDLAEGEKKQCYKNFSQEVAEFTLSTQLTDTTKYPKQAIGGILSTKNSDGMRVDRNQHAILDLMDAYELGILK